MSYKSPLNNLQKGAYGAPGNKKSKTYPKSPMTDIVHFSASGGKSVTSDPTKQDKEGTDKDPSTSSPTLEKAKEAKERRELLESGKVGRQRVRKSNQELRQDKRFVRQRLHDKYKLTPEEQEQTSNMQKSIADREAAKEKFKQDVKLDKRKIKRDQLNSKIGDSKVKFGKKLRRDILNKKILKQEGFGDIDGKFSNADKLNIKLKQDQYNRKYGVGMYKQEDMDNKEIKYGVKNLRSKGGAFPMVAPQQNVNSFGEPTPVKGTMANGGRPMQSNQLANNPNIQQAMGAVPQSTFNTNQKFNDIASEAGTPHVPGTMMPQHKTGYTPAYGQPAKALVGDQDQLPEHLQDAIRNSGPDMYNQDGPEFSMGRPARKIDYIEDIHPSPMKGAGMYGDHDGPSSFDSLVSKLQSEGKSKEAATKIAGKVANAKMHGAGSGPTAAQKARAAMYDKDGPSAYTKVNKGNYKAAQRDDAAHIDYLKRDVKDIQRSNMSQRKKDSYETADEQHISNLAQDMNFNKKKGKYDNVDYTDYSKRKYDNTGSALSFDMTPPYKQVKYSHSFSDSPLNLKDSDFKGTDDPKGDKKEVSYVGKSVGTNNTQRYNNAKELIGPKGKIGNKGGKGEKEITLNTAYEQMLPEFEVVAKKS